ncbi:MAG TPA: NAD(P)H-dependent oxidoreductase [Microvirga sp.]|jgi:putative NADPH-quinone reductase|nr:NAD(P)H-dependent oxidoreductase [Microvirga sp.]
MRVLVLYAHPNPESYAAALHRAALEALRRAGHEVDDCDLYAEGFDPVLSREERLAYHEVPRNRAPVADYVRRLEAAEALVLMFPVWNFGFPAILKGFLDRVFLPGVSFRIEDGLARPNLRHVKRLVAVTTYGAPRWRAFLMGDPPRKVVTRMLRVLAAPGARCRYLALHDMNRQTQGEREAFLAEVERTMGRL